MQITILDGALKGTPKSWSNYFEKMMGELEKHDHAINHIQLKDKDLHHCAGCFKCWVKTPGVCVIADDSQAVNSAIINADFVLFASPMVMGFATSLLKKKMDRMIPLVHPYLMLEGGEMHHLARYEEYPLFGLLLHPESADSIDGIAVVGRIFARTASNIKSRLAFSTTTREPAEKTVQRIINAKNEHFTPRPLPAYTQTAQVGSLNRLTVFNGSPRGRSGNTPILLDRVIRGFTATDGKSADMFNLQQIKKKTEYAQLFKDAHCVLIGFPLYTDGMPGIVKEFIEELRPFTRRKNNPPLAFLVQSGFPEALHSRYVEQYLQTVAERLNSPYLGTLIRGGCEGVRMQPEQMNRKMFSALEDLGSQLAESGGFKQSSVDTFRGRERYSPLLFPLIRLAQKFPLMNFYWDSQLKKNNVYEERFARPYAEFLLRDSGS